MIIAYLLISAFSAGWVFGTEWHAGASWTFWERVGVIGLCLAWPYTLFLLVKLGKDGKL